MPTTKKSRDLPFQIIAFGASLGFFVLVMHYIIFVL